MRALMALLLTSCVPTHPSVVLTPAAELDELTREAAKAINFIAGDLELVTIGEGGVPVELCTREGMALEAAAAGVSLPPGDKLPCGYHSGRRICVSRCADAADLSHDVLVHEIGHALGAKHSRYRGSIMSEHLQQLDIQAAARSLVSALP